MQACADFLDRDPEAVLVFPGFQRPVSPLCETFRAYTDDITRWDLVHVLVHGFSRHGGRGKKPLQTLDSDSYRYFRVGKDCLWLRTKEDARICRLVEQRLHAQPVSNEEKAALAGVPNREGEDPDQSFGDLVSPLEVATQNNLGIASGSEAMTVASEFLAKLSEVVDFATVGQAGNRFIVFDRLHWLLTTFKVNDRKTSMTEGGGAADPHTAGVRATKRHCCCHHLDCRPLGIKIPVVI